MHGNEWRLLPQWMNEWRLLPPWSLAAFFLFLTFAACRLRGVRVEPARPDAEPATPKWEIRSHKSENLARAPEKWEIQNQKVRNWRVLAGKVRNWRDRAKKWEIQSKKWEIRASAHEKWEIQTKSENQIIIIFVKVRNSSFNWNLG